MCGDEYFVDCINAASVRVGDFHKTQHCLFMKQWVSYGSGYLFSPDKSMAATVDPAWPFAAPLLSPIDVVRSKAGP